MRIVTRVPDPVAVTLERIVADEVSVTLVVRAHRARVPCPCCEHIATRVHSRYTRQLADLPWQGLAVRLLLRTRRWFCDNPHCARRIFTERLPTVVAAHGQRTRRLATIIRLFGVAVGGAPGARLLRELGIAVSGDTLRRAVGAAALPTTAPTRVLGVDDWSLRRGHTYGTILVDLEAHRPVDLLPDRSAASLAAWLAAHPGVEMICRDRGGAYADGARQGAPTAVQVADRWHLLANLGELLERLVLRHHAALRQVRLIDPPAEPDAQPPSPPGTSAAGAGEPDEVASRAERERRQRDARREARYQEIHMLHHQGLSIRAVARHVGISKTTVRKYLAAPDCPHPGHRPTRRRLIAPFVPYLRERWDADERQVPVLWAAIRRRGFTGSWRRVREVTAAWRREEREALRARRGAVTPVAPRPASPVGKRCSPRRVATWLGRPAAALTPAQQTYLTALLVACPELDAVRALALEFARLVRARDATGLDPWLVTAEASPLAAVREFVLGIRRDYAAVRAALEHAWSSGQVEGQVNRLKLVKRSMYGRASFALLRRRFLLTG